MTVNILEMLQNAAGKELSAQASRMLGESEQATESAVRASFPALLGGLMSKASSLAGATDLLNIIKGPAVKSDLLLKDLGGLFGGGEATNQTLSLGSTLLNAVFGDKIGNLANAIGSIAGIRGTSATGLLSMVAPLLFSFLKGHVTNNNLNASGLMSLLGGQAQFLQGKLTDTVTQALGLGTAAGFLGNIGGKLLGAAAKVPSGSGSAGVSAPIGGPRGRPPADGDGGYSTLRRLRPWLLLALGIPLFFLFRSCGKDDDANTSPPMAAAPVATSVPTVTPTTAAATAAVATPAAVPSEVPLRVEPTTQVEVTEVPPKAAEAPAETEVPAASDSAAADKAGTEALGTSAGSSAAQGDSSAQANGEAPAATDKPSAARVYFDVGKTKLPADVDSTLQSVVSYALAHSDAKVTVAGFHDPTGNLAKNTELAKNRAGAVRARLKALGIADNQMVMRKPAVTRGSGANAEARRVEVGIE